MTHAVFVSATKHALFVCRRCQTEYRRRGFNEVITPNVFNIDLWKTSGHYENYKENMFLFEVRA